MAAFTRRINVQHESGVDRRYASPRSTNYWVVRYTDLEGQRREHTHYGPDSVKQWLEKQGIRFDFNVEVDFHRK
ncbi:hypothetical protein GII36_00285 [Candidatus Mycosynbacter amalyticus]|uniref:Uncharacterized protein n=1 Tax=Candidatus Mycosynbacter amalyticus TaxID=2665156 RepID=A0A857MLZ8_9BACT|nr:hypothetical protein [Candidatus Mycosynbacter amalyticus]QHN42299.1 hypothetical protein GII36_00285 [Candidatus Mycosynbacter amalyticus]